jgi:hypothetical protein
MKKIIILLLVAVSFSANAQRKLFGLDLNANPELTDRIAIGQVGSLSENMTMQQLLDFTTTNLDVYTQAQINTLFLNYISKTNLAIYTPTLDYHPATKKYVDDGIGIVNNTLEQGWTQLSNGMRMQWFKFISNVDTDQQLNFPYPFPTACVNLVVTGASYTNEPYSKTKTGFTYNRDDSYSGDITMFVQAIGY